MADNHRFTVGLIDGGRHAAASTKAPYFFFVGDSREEVEAIAKRALDFYFEAAGTISDARATTDYGNRPSLKKKFRPLIQIAAA